MRIEIHGYAIVSDDDCIADSEGHMPDCLRNDADWAYFQGELDRSALVVLGRIGHEVTPNPKGRLRLIVSSQVDTLERRQDGWWWNPAGISWSDVVRLILPDGGRVAVPGGRQVFDLFLQIGYTTFHLSRAHGTELLRGVTIFSACEAERTAEDVLRSTGMIPERRRTLDSQADVTLTLWTAAS